MTPSSKALAAARAVLPCSLRGKKDFEAAYGVCACWSCAFVTPVAIALDAFAEERVRSLEERCVSLNKVIDHLSAERNHAYASKEDAVVAVLRAWRKRASHWIDYDAYLYVDEELAEFATAIDRLAGRPVGTLLRRVTGDT